jgi:hypothetical protein
MAERQSRPQINMGHWFREQLYQRWPTYEQQEEMYRFTVRLHIDAMAWTPTTDDEAIGYCLNPPKFVYQPPPFPLLPMEDEPFAEMMPNDNGGCVKIRATDVEKDGLYHYGYRSRKVTKLSCELLAEIKGSCPPDRKSEYIADDGSFYMKPSSSREPDDDSKIDQASSWELVPLDRANDATTTTPTIQ